MTTAAALISQSISTNAIVHAEWTEALETDLLAAGEDSADSPETVETWGTTESGNEWRVHLDR